MNENFFFANNKEPSSSSSMMMMMTNKHSSMTIVDENNPVTTTIHPQSCVAVAVDSTMARNFSNQPTISASSNAPLPTTTTTITTTSNHQEKQIDIVANVNINDDSVKQAVRDNENEFVKSQQKVENSSTLAATDSTQHNNVASSHTERPKILMCFNKMVAAAPPKKTTTTTTKTKREIIVSNNEQTVAPVLTNDASTKVEIESTSNNNSPPFALSTDDLTTTTTEKTIRTSSRAASVVASSLFLLQKQSKRSKTATISNTTPTAAVETATQTRPKKQGRWPAKTSQPPIDTAVPATIDIAKLKRCPCQSTSPLESGWNWCDKCDVFVDNDCVVDCVCREADAEDTENACNDWLMCEKCNKDSHASCYPKFDQSLPFICWRCSRDAQTSTTLIVSSSSIFAGDIVATTRNQTQQQRSDTKSIDDKQSHKKRDIADAEFAIESFPDVETDFSPLLRKVNYDDRLYYRDDGEADGANEHLCLCGHPTINANNEPGWKWCTNCCIYVNDTVHAACFCGQLEFDGINDEQIDWVECSKCRRDSHKHCYAISELLAPMLASNSFVCFQCLQQSKLEDVQDDAAAVAMLNAIEHESSCKLRGMTASIASLATDEQFLHLVCDTLRNHIKEPSIAPPRPTLHFVGKRVLTSFACKSVALLRDQHQQKRRKLQNSQYQQQ